MLLAIDIGNSNITLGGIQEGEILFEARLATDSTKTSDEYGVEIKDMLDLFGARVEEIRDCIVASVVPPVFNSVRNGIVKLTGKEPMVVGPGIKTGINILLEDPGATGADLIAAAVAAVDAYPTPLTVVDMGTATTIAVIDDGNAFLGGAVLPGLRISAEALSSRASLLPGIQLERPRRAIGKNTVECMQSGLMFGAAAMVDGLIDRMEAEGETLPRLFAWYKNAAAQGLKKAQLALADCYEKGRGVPKSPSQARYWRAKAKSNN